MVDKTFTVDSVLRAEIKTGMLSQRFLQKQLISTADTCEIIEISKSTATDEYRIVTETPTTNSNINCRFQILSEDDESVKEGTFRAGDYIFWFDFSNEALCVQGNRITFDYKKFQIIDVKKFDFAGATHLIEVRTAQI